MSHDLDVGFIGFGEAARAFVDGWRDEPTGRTLGIGAYDLLLDDAATRTPLMEACRARDVEPLPSAAELCRRSALVIAAVTADQVIPAAESAAEHLGPDASYVDVNSAAPHKKRAAAGIVGEARYVDAAVLAPVQPLRHRTRILLGGPNTGPCAALFARLGMNHEVVSDAIGPASMIKMIRSVFVKGLESITFECGLAARAAGLEDVIYPSLANVLRFTDAREQADYQMERVAVHGRRRAAEMLEVVETLESLGIDGIMSAASAALQRSIGELDLASGFGAAVPEDASAIADAALEALRQAPARLDAAGGDGG